MDTSDLFARHAAICKTFANPKRLKILQALRDGAELSASLLLKHINISKANLSQHMALLAQKGIVHSRREGVSVFYRLTDGRITQACDLMRQVLLSRLKEEAAALKRFRN